MTSYSYICSEGGSLGVQTPASLTMIVPIDVRALRFPKLRWKNVGRKPGSRCAVSPGSLGVMIGTGAVPVYTTLLIVLLVRMQTPRPLCGEQNQGKNMTTVNVYSPENNILFFAMTLEE